jgi:MoaA/NifB/PqqE/SkfB family radical SAM enzyme
MKITDLVIELTNRCNLKCRMCSIWEEKERKDFPLEAYENILRDKNLGGLRCLALTGGEPFMIPDFERYAIAARKLHPKTHINISSNGTLLSPMMRLFWETGTSNMSLTISYDGKKHDEIRGRHGTEQIIFQNASLLKSRFPELKIDMKFTITPWNYGQISAAVKKCESHGIELQVKLIEELRCYHNRMRPLSFALSDAQMRKVKTDLPKIRVSNKNYSLSLQKSGKRCSGTNKLFINLLGDAYLCRKKAKIGNINQLYELPESIPIMEEMKHCSGCLSYY